MLPAAAARRVTSPFIRAVSRSASSATAVEVSTRVPISRTDALSSSVAAATVSAVAALSCEAAATAWARVEVSLAACVSA